MTSPPHFKVFWGELNVVAISIADRLTTISWSVDGDIPKKPDAEENRGILLEKSIFYILTKRQNNIIRNKLGFYFEMIAVYIKF